MDRLTDRERQVLIMKSSGMTIKEVALKLGISAQTVKNTLTNCYRKLGVKGNRGKTTPALMIALKRGIVRLYEIRLRQIHREDY